MTTYSPTPNEVRNSPGCFGSALTIIIAIIFLILVASCASTNQTTKDADKATKQLRKENRHKIPNPKVGR